MSNRGAEGAAAKTGAGERRTGAGQRVQFEALVAMADAQGGSGFEAESVDVSTAGMRLRTAYLPPVGEKLVCRFDSAGSEIVATGEVIWRNELARGGEFGIRFTDIDREAEDALRGMCVSMTAPSEGEEKGSVALKGTRVRLHIEGLGSPMKARVREADAGEVLVGSNLEFLRVGRSLELEDVDHGVRREAHIDHVKVEIEPGTNIPQLVVSLRYREADKKAREGGIATKAAAAAAAAAAAVTAAAAATAAATATATAAGPERAPARPSTAPAARRSAIDSPPDPEASDASPGSAEADPPARLSRPSQKPAAASADHDHDDATAAADDDGAHNEDEPRAEKLRAFGMKAAAASKKVAGTVGPSLAAMSAKTKGAVAGLVAALQRKRAERAERAEQTEANEAQQPAAPRRMTAPPPTGALRSEGRKLVRDENAIDEDLEATPAPPPANNKRAAIIGSALGLFAVLAVFGLSRFLGFGRPQVDPQGATDPQAAQVATALPSASALAVAAPAASGVPTADVPLFGATPLSTTEPVPSPLPDPSALAPGGLPGGGLAALQPGAPSAMGAAPSGEPTEPSLSDQPGGDDDDEGEGGGATVTGKKEWGQGRVRNPIVLKIKTDGPIETMNGGAGAMGFTISLPGRRSISSASELARKDKRIASLQVVNNANGAEVTVQFKDGIPPYLAKVKGDKLEIALGTEGHKKVASKAGDKKKKAASKKTASKKDASKKDASKKDAAKKKTTAKKPAAD